MQRGELSNTAAPEVWIHAGVVFHKVPPSLGERVRHRLAAVPQLKGIKVAQRYLARARYEVPDNVSRWLTGISFNVRPVVVWVGRQIIADDAYPDQLGKTLVYQSFQEALQAMRVSPLAVEMVVGSRLLLTEGVHLYDGDVTRYGGKQWTLKGR